MYRKILFYIRCLTTVYNYFFTEENTLKEDRNGKTTPGDKPKPKENISRYGSFYLRLGGIGDIK